MIVQNECGALALAGTLLDESRRDYIENLLEPMVPAAQADGQGVTRSCFAAALNLVLFADLLYRVPSGATYVDDVRWSGGKVCFDHGAIRTIRFPDGMTGLLPQGELAFRRILEPLGYEVAAIYPLPTLKMTGRAYRHRDFPETIPQFFVSELHVEEFDEAFGAAAQRVFGTSQDPLDAAANAALARFAAGQALSFEEARRVLPTLVRAFDRQHAQPSLADYEVLKIVSKEAAWIATEGNAFNHATDRVPDIDKLAAEQKAMGRPMKEKIEVSRKGRVRQTAYRADMIERKFSTPEGDQTLFVPGSFYEFISRDLDPDTGVLDLSFDSGNATGIFHMTKAA
ncbi:2-oxoadipate dioxygenase/decarboxylase family protein [Sphingomonas hengshuiensis]|uniref:2-oxoadipate dioxygenase/decarboxylase n=1 Tax=Sphingomonas hengshuiensis TaxID=1609977 RepID=A0A7U4JAW4_9SPHN|nr:DUF1338 family protein [Sphingomonas hengshuiensis]AJP73459.1 IQ calmodulin-binding motif-containing protein [Sphingomonas hengshuiensis]